jgi:peptidoglycan/xylan/chitin deacetylase (PgdA/CDA1 family)
MNSELIGGRPWREPPYNPGVYARPPVLALPSGARTAVVLYLNVEYFRYDMPSPMALTAGQAGRTPDIINYAWRDYGMRAGIWRVLDILDKHGVTATVTLNSDVIRAYPAVFDELMARNYEIACHGVTNSVHLYGLSAEQQRGMIAESSETIAQATGRRPQGWLSPGLAESFESLSLLADAGYQYIADWGIASDLPYYLGVGDLVAVPYTQETNDLPLFILQQRSAEDGYRQLVDQFDVLYEESATAARVYAISLHPFVIGVPHRIGVLDRLLAHILSKPGVWLTQAREIDSWYRQVAKPGGGAGSP